MGGLFGGFGGEILSFSVPTGFGLVATAGGGTAIAVTSSVMVSITGAQVIGASLALGSILFFASDPYVEHLKKGMSKYQQEEFKNMIEEYKIEHGRGGADNLPRTILKEIAEFIRANVGKKLW